jgi:dTDP-4-amino-4,6-dideoxygalactose transaminase
VAHLFGHDADIAAIRHAAPNIPIIEDAVQGLGGKNAAGTPHGAEGDLSIISYDDTKMIGGRGGVVMTDDPDLYAHMCEVAATLFGSTLPDAAPPIEPFCALLSPSAADAFRSQLIGAMPALLRPFDPVHIPRIVEDWRTLDERLRKRERISHLYASGLADLPIILPPLRFTDVIWRYTLTARSPIDAGRIARALQRQNLPGSRLYPPLSQLFGIRTRSGQLENRLINLWVADIDPDAVIHTIQGLHLR